MASSDAIVRVLGPVFAMNARSAPCSNSRFSFIAQVYSNIYYRDDPDKIKEGLPPRYGFFTDKNNKELVVTAMNKGLRDMGFIERDQRMLDECGWYELKQNGSYGAIEGQHDDIYMSSGIALYVSSTLPTPSEIPRIEINLASTHRVRTEADM